MKRNPLPMREQLNRVVPSGSAEDGARGSAPYMGQGTSSLWVGRAKPCPCGALNYFRLAKSSIELLLPAEVKKRGAFHPTPPTSVRRLTRISLAVRQGSRCISAPFGGSVGRSIPSRSGSIFFWICHSVLSKKKSPHLPLTSFSLLAICKSHFSFIAIP